VRVDISLSRVDGVEARRLTAEEFADGLGSAGTSNDAVADLLGVVGPSALMTFPGTTSADRGHAMDDWDSCSREPQASPRSG
jgi:hypothetical protein